MTKVIPIHLIRDLFGSLIFETDVSVACQLMAHQQDPDSGHASLRCFSTVIVRAGTATVSVRKDPSRPMMVDDVEQT